MFLIFFYFYVTECISFIWKIDFFMTLSSVISGSFSFITRQSFCFWILTLCCTSFGKKTISFLRAPTLWFITTARTGLSLLTVHFSVVTPLLMKSTNQTWYLDNYRYSNYFSLKNIFFDFSVSFIVHISGSNESVIWDRHIHIRRSIPL